MGLFTGRKKQHGSHAHARFGCFEGGRAIPGMPLGNQNFYTKIAKFTKVRSKPNDRIVDHL